MPSQQHVSQLLVDWSNGDEAALDKLMPLVYEELRQLARKHMRRENPGHTLQTTALVNEAYLRLVGQQAIQWQNRAHFFAIASRVIRRILVDHARSRHRAKRGGGARKVSLEGAAVTSPDQPLDMIAIDEALTRLAALDDRKGRVVELRLFGGLTNEEAAEILNVSPNTVMRDWSLAQAWLRRELSNHYDA
jgi:RNA polymerase sigma factor (TIGR02999 family)